MDEIFDRIKSIKIKHKTLVITLILTEILGILALIWFLRTPLTQKFLIIPPKTYSIESFDPQKRYVVNQGDFLLGNSNSQNKAVIILRQGKSKENFLTKKLSVDKNGVIGFQMPQDLNPGIYSLTYAESDETNNIKSVQNYKLRINSNYKLYGTFLYKLPIPKLELIEKTTTQLFSNQDHPLLLTATLEFDPSSYFVKQLSFTHSRGDTPPLIIDKPKVDPEKYLVLNLVTTRDNQIISHNWIVLDKSTIKTRDNKYSFQIVANYEQQSKINLYLSDGRLIWTGTMK